jgi:hypothetical protein
MFYLCQEAHKTRDGGAGSYQETVELEKIGFQLRLEEIRIWNLTRNCNVMMRCNVLKGAWAIFFYPNYASFSVVPRNHRDKPDHGRKSLSGALVSRLAMVASRFSRALVPWARAEKLARLRLHLRPVMQIFVKTWAEYTLLHSLT